MAISNALHVVCDSCHTCLHDRTTGHIEHPGTAAVALRVMRREGWTHGTRDLCPACQHSKKDDD
jgi:hypothetical protein